MATLLQWKLCWGFRYGCLSLLAKDPDYGARRLRLGAAVEAGELTLEQSRIMFDDLRKDVAETNEQVFVEAFRERLGTAIDAGKMTPEEALCGPNITPGEANGNGNREGCEDSPLQAWLINGCTIWIWNRVVFQHFMRNPSIIPNNRQ